METNYDMKELLEEEFEKDPLLKEIRINNLEEFLFTESILSMHPETSYKTTEAGPILGKSDSTIRNYFRTELLDYVSPEKNGIYYRLNYKSIFRLHMIFLLVEKVGKSTADLTFLLGISSRVSVKGSGGAGSSSSQGGTDTVNKDIGQIKQMLIFQSLKSTLQDEEMLLIKKESTINEYKRDLYGYQKDIEFLQQKIENIDLKVENDVAKKQVMVGVEYSVNQTEKLNNTEQKPAKQKKGIFSWLFPVEDESNVAEDDIAIEDESKVSIDDLMKDAEEKVKEELGESYSSAKQLLEENIKEIMQKEEELKIKVAEAEKEIETTKRTIGERKRQLTNINNNPGQLDSFELSNLLPGSNN